MPEVCSVTAKHDNGQSTFRVASLREAPTFSRHAELAVFGEVVQHIAASVVVEDGKRIPKPKCARFIATAALCPTHKFPACTGDHNHISTRKVDARASASLHACSTQPIPIAPRWQRSSCFIFEYILGLRRTDPLRRLRTEQGNTRQGEARTNEREERTDAAAARGTVRPVEGEC